MWPLSASGLFYFSLVIGFSRQQLREYQDAKIEEKTLLKLTELKWVFYTMCCLIYIFLVLHDAYPPPPPQLPHSQKRTLQTAFLPQLSVYYVNLNAGYRKLCTKLIPFSFSISIYNNRECSFVILEERTQVKLVTYSSMYNGAWLLRASGSRVHIFCKVVEHFNFVFRIWMLDYSWGYFL